MALAQALKAPALALIMLSTLGCSEDDDLLVRDALPSECQGRGGFVLAQGDRSYAACDGVDGVDGGRGEPGPRGERGDAGPQGEQGLQGVAGLPGPPGAAGDAGASLPGAILAAQVSCTGTYLSDDMQPVFVSLEYALYSDGATWGFCWLEHRNDAIISMARIEGTQCLLVDWTSLASDGSTDLQGQPLRKSIRLDTSAASITEDGGVLLAALTCETLAPATAQPPL